MDICMGQGQKENTPGVLRYRHPQHYAALSRATRSDGALPVRRDMYAESFFRAPHYENPISEMGRQWILNQGQGRSTISRNLAPQYPRMGEVTPWGRYYIPRYRGTGTNGMSTDRHCSNGC